MTLRHRVTHSILLIAFAAAALSISGEAQVAPAPTAPASDAAPPGPVASAETAARVETLLQQLGHENWLVRQTAQDELVLLGPEARARIETLLRETSDEEIRTRLEAALQQMEENRVTGTSVITLHANGLHPRLVFNELARQSYATFRTFPADLWDDRAWPPLTCDAERQPFWAVMKDLCERAGVTPIAGGTDGLLVLAAAPRPADGALPTTRGPNRAWGSAPTQVSGPFLVAVSSISRKSQVDLAAPGNINREVRLMISVYPEPKLRILQGAPIARITEALDEKGQALGQINYAAYMQARSDWVWNLSATLRPAAPGGDRIALLKGSGRFLVQTRSDSAEVDNVLTARSQTRTIGGRKFTLKEVRRGLEGPVPGYVASITLFRAGWTQSEWNYMISYNNNTFRLIDAQGRPLARITTRPDPGPTTERADITVTYRRDNSDVPGGEPAGEPASLLWEVPTETREIPVDFEFKDLRLP